MPNIQQQKKRVRIAERQREENLRYRSTVKTLTKRLEAAAAAEDKDKLAAEHLELVRTIDKGAPAGRCTRTRPRARRPAQPASSPAFLAPSPF